jgi:rare lipoprotein A
MQQQKFWNRLTVVLLTATVSIPVVNAEVLAKSTQKEEQSQVVAKPISALSKDLRSALRGMASWYGPGFHGRRSASGERFNQNALTAAHRNLPFGTKVRVTNLNNGRSVVVRINDRGPFVGGRIIDLSAGAAKMLGMIQSGVAPVEVEVVAE